MRPEGKAMPNEAALPDEAEVSIIMPAYNRVGLIGQALASLQNQRGVVADIIVVDDGSTDGTDRLVEAIGEVDPRVRLIHQDHRGVAAARNTGLRAARGAYVTFLDSDDVAAPNRLARQIGKLAPRPDIVAVVGHRMWFSAMNDDYQPLPESIWEKKLDICLASGMFRRAVFDEFGGFDENLPYGEDIDFYFRLFEADARMIIEVDVATYYRRHCDNMTNDQQAMFKACLRAYHNSMARRRQAGRTRKLDVFFFRKFDHETEFGGVRPDQRAGLP
jgi:glycosyltransferase involved in cell wall biosynthesis